MCYLLQIRSGFEKNAHVYAGRTAMSQSFCKMLILQNFHTLKIADMNPTQSLWSVVKKNENKAEAGLMRFQCGTAIMILNKTAKH
jgi:hypothetical protein